MGESVPQSGSGSRSRPYDRVRAAALEATVLIERGVQLDSAIEQVTRGLEFRSIDRRFLLQLVNGVTKMRRRLDHDIRFYLARPAGEMPIKLAAILRLGYYQIRFTDRIPAPAAVSESVNLAAHLIGRPRASMVNAVLRACLREPEKVRFKSKSDDPVGYLGDFYSYPDYFVRYCLEEFGYEQTEKLLDRFNRPPYVTYRVNFLKAKPDEVANLLQEAGIEFSYGRYLPEFIHIEQGGLPLEEQLIKSGKVFVQDESAGLPVRLLNPRHNDIVVDLTAAPGGKSTYAAIRMRNRGRLTSVDRSRERLEMVVENAERLGITIISPVLADIFEFSGGPYDRVLLDPPCTGWGTAGKHSDLRWSKTEEDLAKLTRIQGAMLARAAKLVKPGGVLVYSTCSLVRAENDQVVEEFLLKHKQFQIDSGAEYFPAELVSSRGFVKTYPDFPTMDGAFCARLRRQRE